MPASVSPVNLRRTLATVAASLALISAVAACGFNYPTDRINNITAGANDRDGTVTVLNAAIVSKEANLGSFVATFVNTSQTQQVSVTSITGDGTAVGQVPVAPFPINPNGLVNLAAEGGITIQGTFSLGQFPRRGILSNGIDYHNSRSLWSNRIYSAVVLFGLACELTKGTHSYEWPVHSSC